MNGGICQFRTPHGDIHRRRANRAACDQPRPAWALSQRLLLPPADLAAASQAGLDVQKKRHVIGLSKPQHIPACLYEILAEDFSIVVASLLCFWLATSGIFSAYSLHQEDQV
ncbi:hypothetical protein WJX79_007564 [Trebouxia sp. C0005]